MPIYYGICFFLLGAILASFYHVLANRLPLGKSIIKPRSHCDSCNQPLSWYELIPIISYIALRGKCRTCHQKINITAFLSELFLGSAFLFGYLHYGISYSLSIYLILTSLLLLIFISDIKYMIILDSPLIIASILIFLAKWICFGLSAAFHSLFAGICLFAFMYGMGKLGSLIFKREALGGGDVKLAFVIGLTLDVSLGLTALVVSTFLALPYATFSLLTKSSHEVAFGPFLISATWLVFLFIEKFTILIEFLFSY